MRRNPHNVSGARVVVSGVHPSFDEHEWRGGNDALLPLDLVEDRGPVGDLQVLAVAQNPDVGTAHQNLLTKVPLQPIHHTDDENQRTHAHDDARDGDEADQREQLRSAAAAQITPRNGNLEPGHSGLIVGKRITSRMFGVPVSHMNSRSTPTPTPPIGGIPYSMARR